jgi:hypothetical protein
MCRGWRSALGLPRQRTDKIVDEAPFELGAKDHDSHFRAKWMARQDYRDLAAVSARQQEAKNGATAPRNVKDGLPSLTSTTNVGGERASCVTQNRHNYCAAIAPVLNDGKIVQCLILSGDHQKLTQGCKPSKPPISPGSAVAAIVTGEKIIAPRGMAKQSLP